MAIFVQDSFTDVASTTLASHTGATGATWTKNTVFPSGSAAIGAGGTDVASSSTAASIYLASGTSASGVPADYQIDVNIVIASIVASSHCGVVGRYATAADTGYIWDYQVGVGWVLFRHVAGASTTLGSRAYTATAGDTYKMRLILFGTSIFGRIQATNGANSGKWLDSSGVWQVAEVDCVKSAPDPSPISAANFAGLFCIGSMGTALGERFDDITVQDYVPPTATGYTISGPASGQVLVASTNFTVTPNGGLGGTDTFGLSDSGAGGTFTPSSLTFTSGTSSPQTFTYTPATTGTKTLSYSSSLSLTLTPTSNSYISVAAPITYAVTDSNIFWSPYNWYSGTSGAMQSNNVMSGATFAQSNNPGAYFKTVINSTTAAGSFTLNCDTSMMGSIAAGNTPVIGWSIDNGVIQTSQLTYQGAGTFTVSIATALSAGSHPLKIYFRSIQTAGSGGDRWNTPESCVKITGIVVDGGSTLTAPTIYSKRAICFADSKGEAVQSVSTSLAPAGQDAIQSYASQVPLGLGAEVGVVAFFSSGLTAVGGGNVPVLSSVYGNYSSGKSRLYTAGGVSGGTQFYPPPDYIFDWHGTNDRLALSATLQTATQTMITNFRAAAPSAWIFGVLSSYGAFVRTPKTAAYAAYNAANPSETKVKLIDIGVSYDNDFNITNAIYEQSGTPHETAFGHGAFSALVLPLVSNAIAGTSTIFIISD